MKICVVHNAYGKLSGEEVAVQNLSRYLRRKNHTVVEFFRDSASIADRGLAKAGIELVYGGEEATFTSFRAGPNYLNLIVQPAERRWSWWGRLIF